MAGRTPIPTNLKLIRGTFRKNQSPKNELAPELALPPCPAELGVDAKLEWGRMSIELHKLGLISNFDRATFAAYCAAYGRWIAAERALNASDRLVLLIETKAGNVIQNPLIGIANKAASDMVRYAIEFGMTPSSRARKDAPSGKDADPVAKYL
ncbi:MAG: phage terminase small subunit P27 family [Methylocella sp.]